LANLLHGITRESALCMAQNARKLAKPDAMLCVARACVELVE